MTSARPPASSERVRGQMSRQRTRDTAAEKALRSQLHTMGLRFRVNVRPVRSIRRNVDIVFGPAKVVVFVDGCFWHSCPEHATFPKANRRWWAEKLARNTERDRDTDELFSDAGWRVLRVWEHEDPKLAARRIQRVVIHRRERAHDESSG
jgi:DNA mismatch endonuclease, patch repair protein